MNKTIHVGMAVTCREAVPAYGNTARLRNDHVHFTPGTAGIVAAVDVPSVWREGVSFCCVDWTLPDGGTDRCALLYDNIVPLDSAR